jgi:hypothetical protein
MAGLGPAIYVARPLANLKSVRVGQSAIAKDVFADRP